MAAYINGFETDIFISYAHLDNKKIFDATRGWIEEFYGDLTDLLSIKMAKKDAIKIWWDEKKLDGSMLFGPAIEEGINKSALLLCLNSRGFLGSDYCKHELSLFYEKCSKESYGLAIGNRSRILNVLLYNIPYTEWPPQLEGVSGFHFHGQFDEGTDGFPFEINSDEYKKELHKLTEIIAKMAKEFPKKKPDPDPEGIGKGFKIYFGETTANLKNEKSKTIEELKKLSFEIVTDIPPPLDATGHENAVKKELNSAHLSVHLLNADPGKKIEGEETTGYSQKQVELSLLCDKSKLIWVSPEMNVDKIAEENYKGFVTNLLIGKNFSSKVSFIRGPESNLTGQITALAEQIKKETMVPQEETAVFLDTHYVDQVYALDLYKCLLEKKIKPYFNPQEDDPKENIDTMEKRISQVKKIIFFFGDVALDWVLHRVIAAKQLIIDNNYSPKDLYVYMVPPYKNTDMITNRREMSKVQVINNSGPGANLLSPCLEIIKKPNGQ